MSIKAKIVIVVFGAVIVALSIALFLTLIQLLSLQGFVLIPNLIWWDACLQRYLSPFLYTISLFGAFVTLYLTVLKGPKIELIEKGTPWLISKLSSIDRKTREVSGFRSDEIKFIFQNTGAREGAILNLEVVVHPFQEWKDFAPNGDLEMLLKETHIKYRVPRVVESQGHPIRDWPLVTSDTFPVSIPPGGFVFFRCSISMTPQLKLRLPAPRERYSEAMRVYLEANREKISRWLEVVKTKSEVADATLRFVATSMRGKRKQDIPLGKLSILSTASNDIEQALAGWEQLPPTVQQFNDRVLSRLTQLLESLNECVENLSEQLPQPKPVILESNSIWFSLFLKIWKPQLLDSITSAVKAVRKYNEMIDQLRTAKRNLHTLKKKIESQRKKLLDKLKKLVKELKESIKLVSV